MPNGRLSNQSNKSHTNAKRHDRKPSIETNSIRQVYYLLYACFLWGHVGFDSLRYPLFLILNRPYKMNDTILDNESLLETTYNCQTKLRGTHDEEYLCYLTCADDGKGNDFTTGEPLLTFEEWLAN